MKRRSLFSFSLLISLIFLQGIFFSIKAQNVNQKPCTIFNKLPGFTKGSKKLIRFTIYSLCSKNVSLYKIRYGKMLEEETNVYDINSLSDIIEINIPENNKPPLDVNGRYYFQVILSGLSGEIDDEDTSFVRYTFQDGSPPKLDSNSVFYDGKRITIGDVLYVNSVSNDLLEFNLSDLETFYYFEPAKSDTSEFESDTTDTLTGAGIDSVIVFSNSIIKYRESLKGKFLEKLFQSAILDLSNNKPKEDKYEIFVTTSDAAYFPDDSLNYVGSDTVFGGNKETYNLFTIVYDTTRPQFDFNQIKRKYTTRDTVKNGIIELKVIINDTLSKVNKGSVIIDSISCYPNSQPEIKDTTWNDNTLVIKVDFSDYQGACRLYLRASDFSSNEVDSSFSFLVDLLVPQIDNFNVFDPDFSNLAADSCISPKWGFVNQTDVKADSFQIKEEKYKPDSVVIKGEVERKYLYGDTIPFNLNDIYPGIDFAQPIEIDSLQVLIAGFDKSGNYQPWEMADTVYISYDNKPPELVSIVVTDISPPQPGDSVYTDSSVVNVWPTYQEDTGIVYFKVREENTTSDSCYKWVSYKKFYQFILENESKREICANIRDKAGNWSETKCDTINYIPAPPYVKLHLADTSEVSCFEADMGYTNDTLVYLIIDPVANYPQFITLFNEDSSYSKDVPVIDSTFLSLAEFYPELRSNQQIIKKCKINYLAKRNDGSVQKPQQSYSILFDNINPQIDSLMIDDFIENPCAAATGFTNDDTVSLKIISDFPDLFKTKIWINNTILVLDGDSCLNWQSKLKIPILGADGDYNVKIAIRDSAGNWSQSTEKFIFKDKSPPNLSFELQDCNTFNNEWSDSNHVLSYISSVDDSGSGLVNLAVDSVESNLFDCEKYVYSIISDGGFYLADSCFKAGYDLDKNMYYLFTSALDSAGNINIVCDSIVAIGPPDISVMLFDYDEYVYITRIGTFPNYDCVNPDSLDSQFTDEDSVVLYVKLKSGNWDSVKYVKYIGGGECPDLNGEIWHPLPRGKECYATKVKNDTIQSGEFFSICIKVKNQLGKESDIKNARILFNNTSPELESFKIVSDNGDPIGTSKPEVNIYYKAHFENDTLQKYLNLAAIVFYDDNFPELGTIICPVESLEGTIPIDLKKEGLHQICGYVVDAADVPVISDCNTLQFEIEKMITHASNIKCDSIQFSSIGDDIVFNYPNPFDPGYGEKTNLIFKLEKESIVKIFIYDPFGNLIRRWETQKMPGFNDGGRDEDLTWDGFNERGRMVASGGYICIVEATSIKDKNDKVKKFGKIAVIKK